MSIADKILRAKEDYDNVYEAGKKSEWDAFWEKFQKGGTRTQYPNAFSYSELTDDTFKPKYDLNVTDAYYMFFGNCGITDLKNLDVKLDFSQCDDLRFAFYGMMNTDRGIGLKRVGVIDGRASHREIYTFQGAFEWDIYLEEIEKIIVSEDGSQGFMNAFNACYSLKEIRFEGVIGQDISFADCPLSRASIESIMAALSPTTSGKTLTLSAGAVSNAFSSAEWSALKATRPNWSFNV